MTDSIATKYKYIKTREISVWKTRVNILLNDFSSSFHQFIRSSSSVFEFTWNEPQYINKPASLSLPVSLSFLSRYWFWRDSEGISVTLKGKRGGEIKVISPTLLSYSSPLNYAFYSIPTSLVFHFLSSFPPPLLFISVRSQLWGEKSARYNAQMMSRHDH